MLEIKPPLRGILMSRLKVVAAVGFGISLASGAAYRYLVGDRRKKLYKRFYRCYDPEADFERMVEAGIFDSIGPDGEICGPS